MLWAFAIGGDDFAFQAQRVPEPATLALLASGALLGGALVRRRRAAGQR